MKDLIKKILKEEIEKNDLITPYRLEERKERYKRIIYKKIQDYIKNGSKGSLDLYKTPIESLPSNLKTVGGGLDLSNTQISSLPEGLKVCGHLYLDNTPISSLPSGLKVGGSLYLGNTPISSLPSGLKVGGNLDLGNAPISSLPSGLKVGGGLYLSNTQISKKYTEEQIRKMIGDSGGYVKYSIWM